MSPDNLAQMNKNIEEVKNFNMVEYSNNLLASMFPCWNEEEIEAVENYLECPECHSFVPPTQLRADTVCFACIRKGL
jgi:hypothetical protein